MENTKRVMIIEDEAIIALSLKKNLDELGFSVQSIVSSGKEALNIIEQIEPDLVFVDINLQGDFDGLETAQIINKVFKIPLIICTGYEKKEILSKTENCGECGFLFKPYNEDLLKDEIYSVISRHKKIHH